MRATVITKDVLAAQSTADEDENRSVCQDSVGAVPLQNVDTGLVPGCTTKADSVILRFRHRQAPLRVMSLVDLKPRLPVPMSASPPDSATAKVYHRGTHRSALPSDTVARVLPFMKRMGITRVANITGLDRLGIPVVMVCRPNSRSLAVSQGKGLTLEAAKASGLMESIEAFHAENITLPRQVTSWSALRERCRVVDPALLCQVKRGPFHADHPLAWVEGRDLMQDVDVWVPYEVVHTDFTEPAPPGSGCFVCTSNGLASGNHLLEAIQHGLCEVVERDAMTLWRLRRVEDQYAARIDLDTIDDIDCRALIETCERAAVTVAAWDMTTDIGLAVFFCTLIERDERAVSRMYPASGHGCHPCREVALLRALTEAAQARLTFSAGARDDLPRSEYDRLSAPRFIADQYAIIHGHRPKRSFLSIATFDTTTFEEDISWIFARLRAVGIEQAIAVDLTQSGFDLPVVRVVVPGLECAVIDRRRYALGARARFWAAQWAQ